MAGKEPHSTLEKCRGIDTTIYIPTGFELPTELHETGAGELHPAALVQEGAGQDSIARNQRRHCEDPSPAESVGTTAKL
jgi:hypothetical protein